MSFSTIQQQKRLIYKIVPIRRKRKVKMYERRGGQAPPSWEYMSGVNMIRYGWIWLDTHTIPFIWPCVMTSVSTKKFDFKKIWKTKKSTQSKHIISQKNILYKDSPGNKHKKGKNKSIKTWCLRSSVYFVVCVWCSCFVFGFSFCILVSKLLVFLFAMLLCFSWFNPLLFKKAAGFKTFFHYKEHQNKLLVVYNLLIKRKTDSKCMKGRGDRLTPLSNTFLGSIWLDFRHAWK